MSILPGAAPLALESGEEPFHLDYEQYLEPYVDGRANDIDREIVDSHVALCSKCAADLKDLLEFKQRPFAVVGTRSRRWIQMASPAWTAAAAIIAVFVLGAAVFLWTRSPASLPIQSVETVSPRPETQKPPVATEQPSTSTEAPTKSLPSPSVADLNMSTSPRGEPLAMVYDADGQLTLNQRGQLEGLQSLPHDLKESVEQALTTGRLDASPALSGWTTGTHRLRGAWAQTGFEPLDPIDVVVETDLPTFRWRALEGAQHYVVTIYDMKLRQVHSSGPVSGTVWTTSNSLARGGTYSWQISALKDGETVVSPKPPLPEARFKILDQRALTALRKLREAVGNSHLALGVFYWKHGLLEQSEHEFQALATANPNSTTVTGLLASIRALRHRRV